MDLTKTGDKVCDLETNGSRKCSVSVFCRDALMVNLQVSKQVKCARGEYLQT
jgi:hypothetical protein